MALEFFTDDEFMIANSKNIINYSDSLSSLVLLSSAFHYKMDIDTFHCLRIINNLASRGIRTYFLYIPSHSGIIGNHKADEIANNALIIDQPSWRPIPIRDIYRWRLPEVLLNKNNPTLSPFPNKHLLRFIIEFGLAQMG